MPEPLRGLHHITAIAGDPQTNRAFYTDLLGLRLVKVTVNFDDPTTYHLYYGDALGSPGTVLTFFPWPGAPRGRPGTGMVTALAYTIPPDALTFWRDRLQAAGVTVTDLQTPWDERGLAFSDPDGLPLELIAWPDAAPAPWTDGPVPPARALGRFFRVILRTAVPDRTQDFLTRLLGFVPVAHRPPWTRLRAGQGPQFLDLLADPAGAPGQIAVGTIHHVAWRLPDDPSQAAWRQYLLQNGVAVSPIMDRQYFHSIYFREPGGALFEVATDPPGFTADEPPAQLGSGLRLPPWLEPERARIAAALPPLRLAPERR